LRFSQKFEQWTPPVPLSRHLDFLGQQTSKGRNFMLKFYFNGAPNPNKVALFLIEVRPAL
jgi:hypothetical protein